METIWIESYFESFSVFQNGKNQNRKILIVSKLRNKKDFQSFINCKPLTTNNIQFALKGRIQEIISTKSDLCSASDSSMTFFMRLFRI